MTSICAGLALRYASELYGDIALDIVSAHPAAVPLFLLLAWQAPHVPYDPVPGWTGPIYPGKLWSADVLTGRLVALLRQRKMWETTLIVYASDNGGVTTRGSDGTPDAYGVNWPLRGEKHSVWEGGVRTPAFVSGGFVPQARRRSGPHGGGWRDWRALRAAGGGRGCVRRREGWGTIRRGRRVSSQKAAAVHSALDEGLVAARRVARGASEIAMLLSTLLAAGWLVPQRAPPRAPPPSMSTTATTRAPVVAYSQVTIASPAPGPPTQQITVVDLMPYLRDALAASGLRDGSVNVISRHTTTCITINEWESRLAKDLRGWLLALAPPDDRSTAGAPGAGVAYLHNDIDQRPDSADERERCLENGWDVDDPAELQRWRDQEPINAHSHLAAMLVGSSETIPVCDGKMVLGQWQSVMLVDVDGPRERTVGVQCIGFE